MSSMQYITRNSCERVFLLVHYMQPSLQSFYFHNQAVTCPNSIPVCSKQQALPQFLQMIQKNTNSTSGLDVPGIHMRMKCESLHGLSDLTVEPQPPHLYLCRTTSLSPKFPCSAVVVLTLHLLSLEKKETVVYAENVSSKETSLSIGSLEGLGRSEEGPGRSG